MLVNLEISHILFPMFLDLVYNLHANLISDLYNILIELWEVGILDASAAFIYLWGLWIDYEDWREKRNWNRKTVDIENQNVCKDCKSPTVYMYMIIQWLETIKTLRHVTACLTLVNWGSWNN